MGGHKVKISKDINCTTLGLNVISCAPYAADFDGDAMNILAIDTPLARAEVEHLCDMSNRIIHLKSNSLSLS
jgi:DNA-directed RNA polymerase II subunit RPB1